MKTKNLITRTISGIFYVGALVGAVLAGGVWMILLTSLLAMIGVYEFLAMTNEGKFHRVASLLDISAAVLLQIVTGLFVADEIDAALSLTAIYLIVLLSRVIVPLYAKHRNPVNSLARSIMAHCYIAIPLALFNLMQWSSPYLTLTILILIWVNDTGAYCVGSTMGRHKLFESISPKKTWEGFFGGLIFSVIAAIVLKSCLMETHSISIVEMSIMGVFVSIFATYGDLLESQIKRTCGVKDSGKIIPGHGGVLDRIDSLLLVVPTNLLFLFILNA